MVQGREEEYLASLSAQSYFPYSTVASFPKNTPQ